MIFFSKSQIYALQEVAATLHWLCMCTSHLSVSRENVHACPCHGFGDSSYQRFLTKTHALFTFPQAQTQSPIGSRRRLHALPAKITELTNLTNAPADASTKESLQ